MRVATNTERGISSGSAKGWRAVIAVSEQTAADVIACFGAPPARVHVVHNGVGAEFTPGDPVVTARLRAAHGLPARFSLPAGTLDPRHTRERRVGCVAGCARLDASLWRGTETRPIDVTRWRQPT